MEGAPIFNYEDNSDSDDSEQLDARDKKSKKRKKGTPEWLQRLLKTDSEKLAEEDTKANRFLEAIKSPFGRMFGVEKEELTEEETEDQEQKPAETEFRLPFMPAAFSGPEAVMSDTDSKEEDSDPSPELPQGLLINEDTAEEIASWAPEVPAELEFRTEDEPVPVPMEEEGIPEVATESLPEESVVDRLRAEVESHAMMSTDIHPDRNSYDAGYTDSRGETSPVKEREIVVEKRGGAGAAAVGFVAAELLSRSRDKKIRREAKQLKKKVTGLEQDQKVSHLEARKTEARNQEQLQELKQKREIAPSVSEKPRQISRVEKASTERVYSPSTERVVGQPRAEVFERVHLPRQLDAEQSEAQRYERIQEERQEILTKIQEAAEQPYAGEVYYERKHEVKDEPTTREKLQGAVGSSSTIVNNNAPKVDDTAYGASSYANLPQPKPEITDEYKQAIVQGATTGIILLVGFVIVLILWSLL